MKMYRKMVFCDTSRLSPIAACYEGHSLPSVQSSKPELDQVAGR